MQSVVSTHVTTTVTAVPGRLVCEVEPGIFVIEGGSVKSADVAAGLFAAQTESERRPFMVSARQLQRVRRIAASRELN